MYPKTLKERKMLHGADYNPDQWLDCPDILTADIELMKAAKINCVSVGIFAWAKLEPQEGDYRLDWLEAVIERLYENGIYTVLATPSGAKPLWMSEKYEEIRRVDQSLHRALSGERHNHCYSSPVYREKVRQINGRLAQRFGQHPGVILWHLSNEYGGVCYCPLCQEAFRDWLKKKYKTLEALNRSWWTAFWSHSYTDWRQIHAPVPRGETGTHGLNLDWKRFTTAQVADFMAWEARAVRDAGSQLPVTANLMYDFYEYDNRALAAVSDVVSWDAYPNWHGPGHSDQALSFAMWHDYMRCLKQQPFLLMESTPSATNWQSTSKLKRPLMHLTSSMQAVAHGSNSVMYFQFRKSRGAMEKFHGAVVDHVGTGETRVFRDVAAVGEQLEALGEVTDTMPRSRVAILYDTENRWAVEDAKGPRNCGIHYIETVRDHYRAFWEQGINVDVVDQEAPLMDYQLVIAPMLYLLKPGTAEKLETFVNEGGRLVMTYHSGIVDETDLCFLGGWPGDGLMALLGVWNEEIDSLYDGETCDFLWQGKRYQGRELCAILHQRGAEVLGSYDSAFYAGTPAVTRNAYGQGKAYYLATRPEMDFLRDFYGELVKELSIESALGCRLPEGVEAVTRENEEQRFLFLQNYSDAPIQLTIPAGYRALTTGTDVREKSLKAYDSAVLVQKKNRKA